MARPFRRYAFVLAERLGMTVNQVLESHTSHDIAEWMAHDWLQDPENMKKLQREQELEASRQMSDAERAEAFKKFFGGS